MPMNRMRRKFLRLLISSQAYILQLGNVEGHTVQEEIMKMTDDALLKEWYWMHAMWTGKPPEERRSEDFQERLNEVARMMTTEAILYSEEELDIITTNAEVNPFASLVAIWQLGYPLRSVG